MGLGTTTSPAPAQTCCLAAASSLSTRGCRSCGKRWGPKDAWCHMPQQWLARTTAPQVSPDDRRRFDFVVYGATRNGEALCADATLVSPLTRAGHLVPGADARDGVALAAARRRKAARDPELTRGAHRNWSSWLRKLAVGGVMSAISSSVSSCASGPGARQPR